MRRPIIALLAVLPLACASPAAAQLQDFKNKGTVTPCKYSDRQLSGALGELPPDVEQYAPGYAEQLRSARGAPCGGKNGSTPGGGGTTTGARERVESVPAPGSGGGSGGSGSGAGAGAKPRVAKPPAPTPAKRARLADVSSPAVVGGTTGPDVPLWALILAAVALLLGITFGVMRFLGVDTSRFTRPFGAASGEARARTSNRAAEVWDTMRFGR